MGELLGRFKILMAIFFILVILISCFTIYLPMRDELKKNSIEKFVLTAKSNDLVISQYIERCVDSVDNLLSKHIIESNIDQYEKGVIDREQLKATLSALYLKELESIKDVVAAKRVLENQEIMSYGRISDFKNPKQYNSQKTLYDVDFQGIDLLIIVYSPIKYEGKVLGYDIVYFDMNPILRSINNGDMKTFVLNADEAETRMEKKLDHLNMKDVKTIEDGNFIGYLYSIKDTDKFLYTRIPKSTIFSSIDKVTRLYSIGLVIIVFAFVIFTAWITDKNTKKAVNKYQKSIQKYREYAIKDSLTEVYSRFFIDSWISGNIMDSELISKMVGVNYIIFIDIDNFKSINDRYGHVVGDRAIKRLAQILKSSVRDEDLVVRYGGDEFLILLKNTNRQVAEKILDRIMNTLRELDEFEFSLTISGGIEELKDIHGIVESLKSADDKMYNSKKMKKQAIS